MLLKIHVQFRVKLKQNNSHYSSISIFTFTSVCSSLLKLSDVCSKALFFCLPYSIFSSLPPNLNSKLTRVFSRTFTHLFAFSQVFAHIHFTPIYAHTTQIHAYSRLYSDIVYIFTNFQISVSIFLYLHIPIHTLTYHSNTFVNKYSFIVMS